MKHFLGKFARKTLESRPVASSNVVVWGVGFSEVVCLPEVIMRLGMVAASTVSQEQEYYR